MTTSSIRNASARQSGRRLAAIGMMAFGFACFAPVLAAERASAWEGSCFDFAPQDRPWTELVVRLDTADATQLAGAGQSFSDGALTVTLSGATAADASAPLTVANVGSVDFTASPGVDAAYVRAGGFDDQMFTYYPPAPTPAGSDLRSVSGTTPIEWVSFCYAPVAPAATTSTVPSTTSTVPATTTTAPAVVAPAVTSAPPAQVEVLAETQAAPELAFTGRESTALVLAGLALIASGAALFGTSRLAGSRAADGRRAS